MGAVAAVGGPHVSQLTTFAFSFVFLFIFPIAFYIHYITAVSSRVGVFLLLLRLLFSVRTLNSSADVSTPSLLSLLPFSLLSHHRHRLK